MNKTEYLAARRLVRGIGLHALRWMSAETRQVMTFLHKEQKIDKLAAKGHEPFYDYDEYNPEEDAPDFPQFLNRSRITCEF